MQYALCVSCPIPEWSGKVQYLGTGFCTLLSLLRGFHRQVDGRVGDEGPRGGEGVGRPGIK